MTNRSNFNDIFEHCLSALLAGETIDQVLAAYPEQASELRPLLLAAAKAGMKSAQITVPVSARARSRARFLAEAERRAARKGWFWMPARALGTLALILLAVFASLFVTGLASAESLPGQPLYPVKRAVEQAQLALTTSQTGRLLLEERFDQRRVGEARQLIDTRQSQAVDFAGFMVYDELNGCQVADIRLQLTAEQEILAQTLNGAYVEVRGNLQPDGLLAVDSLSLRLFRISGELLEMQPEAWVVDGIRISLASLTQIVGQPVPGDSVSVTAIRLADERFLALSARESSLESAEPTYTFKPLPTQTQRPSTTPQPVLSPEDSPADDDRQTKTPEVEPTSVDDGDGGDHSGEDGEATRTPEDNSGSGKTPETDEPSRTPDPTDDD